jgi:hypothetical protein
LANIATTTVTNGDFFIVKVTAADATVNFSRFNLTVNSDVATLVWCNHQGSNPTLGTPNALLASVGSGHDHLTTAQATGTDTTTFTKTDDGANISRIVKYSSGASTSTLKVILPLPMVQQPLWPTMISSSLRSQPQMELLVSIALMSPLTPTLQHSLPHPLRALMQPLALRAHLLDLYQPAR